MAPALHPWQSAFTSGEISDQLDARTDWAKYNSAAKCLGNFVCKTHGGIARRAGSVYLGDVKEADGPVRLVRFEFNVEQAYVLEFGHLYVRIWANRARVLDPGGAIAELAVPYFNYELMQLRFEQSADVLYIAHTNHMPALIQRVAANVFQYGAIPFTPGPTAPLDDTLPQPITGTLTVTGSRQAGGYAAAAAPAGTINFTYLTDYLAAQGSVPIRFANGTPQSIIALDPASSSFTLFLNGDMPAPDEGLKHAGSPPAFIPDGSYAYDTNSGTYTFPPASQKVEKHAWNTTDGFPGVVALFQQRLWWAGSTGYPDRIWGSQVADYTNYADGVGDDEAVTYQLAFSGVNMIRWMKAMPAGLAVGTSAGELTLEGGNDNPLTPTNVRARERTFLGSDATVDAVRAVNLVLFVQRGALRIREFTFALEQDNYVAPDLTLTAEHLTREGIIDFARSASPDSILFVVTADGQLLSCAYERPENVVAWSHHVTGEPAIRGGAFERVCVIPNPCGTGDEVWVVARRLIGGVVKRFIEVFDGRLNVDSGLVYEGVPASIFTGLGHLEGMTVAVVTNDGSVYSLVVSGGTITLPHAATRVEAGLPYTSTLMTVRPELPSQGGTAQARRKHWHHATVRVYCTEGALLFNGQTLLERPEGAPAIGHYTGDLARQLNFGWDREGQLVVQTLEPKTCTILGITGAIAVEDQ